MQSNRKIKNICMVISFLVFSVFLAFNHVTVGAISTLSEDTLELTEVGSQLTKLTYGLDTELYDNQFIKTDLLTPTFSDVEVGDELTVKYNIQIPDLYETASKNFDEIVIIIDNSKGMYGENWSQVKEFFSHDFANELFNSNLKVGVIPLRETVDDKRQFESTTLVDVNNLDEITNAFSNNEIWASQYDEHRGIDPALNKASALLYEGFHQNKKQAIIIVSSGYMDVYWPGNIEGVNRRNETVISISIDNNNQNTSGSSAHYIHTELGGKEVDYFEAYTYKNPTINSTLKTVIRNVSTKNDNDDVVTLSGDNLAHLSLSNFDEVIFAIDSSNRMVGDYWNEIKDFFKNYFEYSSNIKNIKMGIIPFHNTIMSPDTSHNNQTNFNYLLNLNDLNNVKMIRDAFGNNYIYPDINQNGRTIDNVLSKATDLFDVSSSNRKAIIFISSGEYNVNWAGNIENFNKLGYKAITLDFGENNNSTNSAYNIHQNLLGSNQDYLLVNHNDNPSLLEILKQIFGVNQIINPENPAENPIKNLELRFDLGSKFEVVSGLIEEDNYYTYNVDEITSRVENGKYIYDPIEVEFTVRVKEVEQSFSFNSAQVAYKYESDTFNLQDIQKPIFESIKIPNINATLLNVSPNPTTLNGEIDITYRIEAESFEYDKKNNELKEIVLLIDGTANKGYYNNLFDKAINGKAFYDFFEENNVKLGLVIYGDKNNIINKVELTRDTDSIKQIIQNLNKNNGTPNLNAALDVANSILEKGVSKNKNIIIMNSSNSSYNLNNISNLQGKYGIYTTDQSYSLKSLHNYLAGNIDDYIEFGGNGHLGSVLATLLEKLTDKLISSYTIKDAILTFDLGDNLKSIFDNTNIVKIDLQPIQYQLKIVDGKQIYEANNIENVTFKVKATALGVAKFAQNTVDILKNSILYSDINHKLVQNSIDTPVINVIEDDFITIQVSDSSGNIDHLYNSLSQLIQDGMVNSFGQQYNLYGDAYANIKLEGKKLNHIEYQIVQDVVTPDFPEDDWKSYTVGKDGIINEDIDLDNPGNLTQKSYNVSHMPTLTGNAQWSDRDLVFQTPFDEVKYKPTTTASTKDEYVTKVVYIDENGKEQIRWETNCVFTNNQSIGGDYKEATKSWGYFKAPTTGYYEFKTYTDDGMKATLTLDDKTQFVIVDEFYPRGAGNGVVSNSRVYLEEGKFYPIYIEYFNWGGSAAFKYEYRVSQEPNSQVPSNVSYQSVPSDAFYPSKSKNPGEGSNNIFVGQSGIKIPDEIGQYYILYKAGSSNEDGTNFEETFRGVYGPFYVEDRFELTRELMNSTIAYKQGDVLSFEYKIQPRDIIITDLYKTQEALNGQLVQTLTVKNATFKETIPSTLEIKKVVTTDIDKYVINLDISGNSVVSGPINHDIIYTLQLDANNIANSKYVAQPISLSIDVIAKDYGQLTYTDRFGVLSYRDITLDTDKSGATKDSFFNSTTLEIEQSSEIIKHGLYTNQSGSAFIDELNNPLDNLKVVRDMNYTFGATMQINASTSTFTIEIPKQVQNANVSLDTTSLKLYELNADGSVNKQTEISIPSSHVGQNNQNYLINSLNENNRLTLIKGSSYLVTYSLKFSESIGLSALKPTFEFIGKVDITNRNIKLELMQKKLESDEQLYLPDLL